MKDTRVKGLWNLLPWFRRAADTEKSLHGVPERPLCEVLNVKLRMLCSWMIVCSRRMATREEWAQLKRDLCCRGQSRDFRDGTKTVVLFEECEMAGNKGGLL